MRWAIGLLLALAFAAACGVKAPPRPPVEATTPPGTTTTSTSARAGAASPTPS